MGDNWSSIPCNESRCLTKLFSFLSYIGFLASVLREPRFCASRPHTTEIVLEAVDVWPASGTRTPTTPWPTSSPQQACRMADDSPGISYPRTSQLHAHRRTARAQHKARGTPQVSKLSSPGEPSQPYTAITVHAIIGTYTELFFLQHAGNRSRARAASQRRRWERARQSWSRAEKLLCHVVKVNHRTTHLDKHYHTTTMPSHQAHHPSLLNWDHARSKPPSLSCLGNPNLPASLAAHHPRPKSEWGFPLGCLAADALFSMPTLTLAPNVSRWGFFRAFCRRHLSRRPSSPSPQTRVGFLPGVSPPPPPPPSLDAHPHPRPKRERTRRDDSVTAHYCVALWVCSFFVAFAS
jgi:hypothetical protein